MAFKDQLWNTYMMRVTLITDNDEYCGKFATILRARPERFKFSCKNL